MNRLVLLAAGLAMAVSAIPARATETLPDLPALEPLLAQGWTVQTFATGDLDKDGVDDYAIVLEGSENPPDLCKEATEYTDAPPRLLAILLSDGKDRHVLSVNTAAAILRADQGGVMGDPFMGVAIKRGTLVIDHAGGSRWRWADTERYRQDDGQWRLIGTTETTYDSVSGATLTYDYNVLSQKMLVTAQESPDSQMAREEPLCVACRVGEQCPEGNGCYAGTKRVGTGETWIEIGPRPDILLSDYLCWRERTGLLAHTGFQSGR